MTVAGFNYVEALTSTNKILKDLGEAITKAYSTGTNNWAILKEEKDAQMRTTKLYLKGKTKKNTEMFLLLTNLFDKKMIKVTSAETMIVASETVTMTNPTNEGEYHFVKPTSTAPRDENTPINYFLSVNNEKIALVVQGDPTIDFTGYVKNLLYFGALNSMDEADSQNICLSYGSETKPGALVNYGQYTSDTIQTVAVLKTKSGVLWQKHYPAFITQQQAVPLEVNGFNASRWTGKYHLSPIYIVHPYDGYRGTLDGVIGVNKNNILHLDELLVETKVENVKDRYKYFDCNTTNDFLMNSPHTDEGVAILKSPSEGA